MSENWRKRKNGEIKQQVRATILISYTQYIHSLSKCVPSFTSLGFMVTEKSVTKKITWTENWRGKNGEITE